MSPFERQVSASSSFNDDSSREPASVNPNENQEEETISLFEKVLQTSDIKEEALFNAFDYFDENHENIDNQDWITVFDIGMHSGDKRFYMINMETGDVHKFHTAHGKKSDLDHDGYATDFSNINGSNQSSLGFMLTAETYSGRWGRSMRLDGLESKNSNVRARAIVIHGASYVDPSWDKMGRSLGCPALPMDDKDWIITQIHGGSLFYTYHEDYE